MAERLRDEVSRLRRELKIAVKDRAADDEIRSAIFRLAAEPSLPPAWTTTPTAPGLPGVPVTIWSDWHCGETVELAETAGVNEFNLAIAEKRIRKLAEKTVELAIDHMVRPEYPGIVVCLGGDMVSGDIHDELRQTNELESLPTVLWVADRIIAALRALADRFGRVFVPCVSGNHGRQTRRIEHKRFAQKNYDHLIYLLVERAFVGDARVTVMAPESNEAAFTVVGHRYLLLHGHDLGVKGGDGIIGSLGPIMRGKIKVGAQRRSYGLDFDTLVMGHWHQYIQLRGLVVNGSLKGHDGFAASGLRCPVEPATQALWFTHPLLGITARWPIYLQQSGTTEPKPPVLVWQA